MEVYKAGTDHTASQPNVSNLFANGWNPGQTNGGSARGWGKTSDAPLPQDPDVCWEESGNVRPMWTQEISQEEKEVGVPRDVRLLRSLALEMLTLPES